MIRYFRVRNYKALRDVSLELTPVHVLIGPNDTGKTSILEAMTALSRSVDGPLVSGFPGRWDDSELVWLRKKDLPVTFQVNIVSDGVEPIDYELECAFGVSGRSVVVATERWGTRGVWAFQGNERGFESLVLRSWQSPDSTHAKATGAIHDALTGVRLYRWVPSVLALPVVLGHEARFELDSSGFGLVRCLDDIQGDDAERYSRLKARFRSLFPEIAGIKLARHPGYQMHGDQWGQVSFADTGAPGKGLYFTLAGSETEVPASQMSDGVLLVLAYLTVLNLLHPPRLLLIEEPENGIHPARLKEVLGILRELVAGQSHTQVLLTTHSPYVLDLFRPEEVTLCRKTADGAVTTHRLSDSKIVQEQIDVFTLGEIWTAEGEERLAVPAQASEGASK